jgi:hypothetical protein
LVHWNVNEEDGHGMVPIIRCYPIIRVRQVRRYLLLGNEWANFVPTWNVVFSNQDLTYNYLQNGGKVVVGVGQRPVK